MAAFEWPEHFASTSCSGLAVWTGSSASLAYLPTRQLTFPLAEKTVLLMVAYRQAGLEQLAGHSCPIAWFLGSGCSVSSGIPTGTQLVSRWILRAAHIRGWLSASGTENLDAWNLDLLKADKREDFRAHFSDAIGSDPLDKSFHPLGKHFAKAAKVLLANIGERLREFNSLCNAARPSVGYAAFATLAGSGLRENRGDFVVTTNFDDLPETSLHYWKGSRPFVLYEPSLISYVAKLDAFTIIKIHGDHRFHPKMLESELVSIPRKLTSYCKSEMQKSAIAFIGYGGHDEGVVKMLHRVQPKGGVFWISSSPPPSDCLLSKWLATVEDLYWIPAANFDQAMLQLLSLTGHTQIPPPALTLSFTPRLDFLADASTLTWQDWAQRCREWDHAPLTISEAAGCLARLLPPEFPTIWAPGVRADISKMQLAARAFRALARFGPIKAGPNDPTPAAIVSFVNLAMSEREHVVHLRIFFKSVVSREREEEADSVRYLAAALEAAARTSRQVDLEAEFICWRFTLCMVARQSVTDGERLRAQSALERAENLLSSDFLSLLRKWINSSTTIIGSG